MNDARRRKGGAGARVGHVDRHLGHERHDDELQSDPEAAAPRNGAETLEIMRVGILGSGLMGGKLGTIFARAGHEVVFTYARTREKLEKLAREAGKNARAGT